MAKNSDITSGDFITRDDFIDWVLNPTPESDLYWNQFLQDNPSLKKEINDAAFIIKSITSEKKELNEKRFEKLWSAIEQKTIGKKRSLRFTVWTAAAGFLILFGLSSLLNFFVFTKPEIAGYQPIDIAEGGTGEVKLIFSDKSEKSFGSSRIDIAYKKNGEIEINSADGKESTTLAAKTPEARTTKQPKILSPFAGKNQQEQLNQLVVPRGKRTSLTLSDGTKMYLNSDSYAVFPVAFVKEKREIFVEGEAYFEVAHDETKPFVVNTKGMSVVVLGTKFGISAYPEDPISSVALVEGSVKTIIDSQELSVKPNQVVIYERKTKGISLKETNILPYVSWKEGWLYCEKETLGAIANKLSRYYDINIEFEDEDAAQLSLSGKLDLKSDCADIFKSISAIAPINCVVNENKIIVSQKKKY